MKNERFLQVSFSIAEYAQASLDYNEVAAMSPDNIGSAVIASQVGHLMIL